MMKWKHQFYLMISMTWPNCISTQILPDLHLQCPSWYLNVFLKGFWLVFKILIFAYLNHFQDWFVRTFFLFCTVIVRLALLSLFNYVVHVLFLFQNTTLVPLLLVLLILVVNFINNTHKTHVPYIVLKF